MRKTIRLNENQLIQLVKKIILEKELEEEKVMITPYELEAINNMVSIKDNKSKKVYKYKLQVKKLGFWNDVDVLDFPEGNKIKVSTLGIEKEVKINKSTIKDIISKNLGNKEIEMEAGGNTLKFVKV